MIPFQPAWLLSNRHAQTLLGLVANLHSEPFSETRIVALPDGDSLALEVSTPPGWSRRDPTVVMLHGLTGSHRSAYMIRLAVKFFDRGWRAVRLNARGCGTGLGLARRPYHAGLSDDVRVALEDLYAEAPNSPTTLAGFSLGGNVALKLAGELGDDARRLLREVITFCPSADLHACHALLKKAMGGIYERMFLYALRKELLRRNTAFPDDLHEVPDVSSLHAFDDQYTARQWGFESADDYYHQASARSVLERIRVPTRVTLAVDDPIVDPSPFEQASLPACVEVRRVAGGGHMGFLASRRTGGLQWLDTQLLRWTA